ncbi:ATP-binding protein [Bosea sp. PAMC 26642]|uniref:ATP-binding protein n=1 Tax=Bosea sp. (strain PAMC 26642) TaxID=1792307 RepID=UPI00076FFBD9|nr:winged helix-turn-helix domain-containing protein [Bosea sp. PAMC 26642]AMJ63241.1 transcriptional regulator [Bosea sp. PAMC 26642]
MTTGGGPAAYEISFGPFLLRANERLLTKEGVVVELGARTYDLLIALTSAPNEVISKQDLIARVWPEVVVEEGSLRFHMNSLRKALGDGREGARFIKTMSGRGYCFVAAVSRALTLHLPAAASSNFPHANLPSRLNRIIGRDEDVLQITGQLETCRLVTIVGAGGIGKTTVAIAVGHGLSDDFEGAVLFVDLGMLSDARLVTTAIASMLGIQVGAGDAQTSLIAFLRNKRALIVLDTCEHVVETVALLASSLVEAASQVYILATSREPLKIEGERVYRLDSLACPPDDRTASEAAIRQFPATRLFIERAVANDTHLALDEADAPIVAGICRKLDGVALAIELTARRVEAYGVRQTAALLDQHLTLQWTGSRTAQPRHRTLQATLDWSYELLSELERAVLRRLAVFVGHFTLDAAVEVVASSNLDRSAVLGAVDSLVAKSMVVTRPIGAMLRYRLLDTTRAYALATPLQAHERADLAVRHSIYYQRWLAQSAGDWASKTTGAERASYFAALNNVRAALEWCFGEDGEIAIGVKLAAAAGPALLAMSLMPEALRWSRCAILALDDNSRGGVDEMHLQAVFGIVATHLYGKIDAALVALNRGLEIAEARGDVVNQVGLLSMLRTFYFRSGDFKTAHAYARRCKGSADTIQDFAASAQARSILGRSLHLAGDLAAARVELEASLLDWTVAGRTTIYLSHELHFPSEVTMVRNLWLQGFPDQATERTHKVIESAVRTDRPAALTVVLGWAVSVFLWTGNWEHAQEHIDALIYQAETNSLGPFIAAGRARRGELAILRGAAKEGVEDLRASLATIHSIGYEVLTTEFNISLIRGLKAVGNVAEAAELAERTIRNVERKGDDLYMPELLRIKGNVLLAISQRHDEAQACFRRSIDMSRLQGARGWELRTATDLARMMNEDGNPYQARKLLEPVLGLFVEGEGTADVREAEQALAEIIGSASFI